jgi:hypothetical protein
MSLIAFLVVLAGTIVFTLVNDHLPVGGDYIDDHA